MLIFPQDIQQAFERHKNDVARANKGLLFERFFDSGRIGHDLTLAKEFDPKAWSYCTGPAGDAPQLEKAVLRRVQLVTTLKGQYGVFKTDWHFVTGMGLSHPAENGMSWHPVLGTPYMPGSGVKGLLRAWLQEYAFPDLSPDTRDQYVLDWFGGTDSKPDEGSEGKAGNLIFFDAFPVERPTLGVDIMTPHMGKWYEQGDGTPGLENTPGDWHSPVPVSFLVTKKSRFLFSIAPRRPEAVSLANEAMEHLKQALAWLGAGAKTAAGYGHMSFEDDATQSLFKKVQDIEQQQQDQKALAAMSKEERDLKAIQDRVDKGEGKGRGPSCVLAADLASLCEQGTTWAEPLRKQLYLTAVNTCKHLGIDPKNAKWKARLQPLRKDG